MNLYAGVLGQGRQESSLVWMHISAFLVVHGLIIQPLLRLWFERTSSESDINATLVLLVAVAGIFLTAVWWLLNYAGWCNQNLFYWYAHQVGPLKTGLRLPTDYWRYVQRLRPSGNIYLLAQMLPVLSWIVYFLFLWYGLKPIVGGKVACGLVTAAVLSSARYNQMLWIA